MPFSELYVMQHLLQQTLAGRGGIVWREKETDGYLAEINGITVEFASVHTNIGPRLYVTFSEGLNKVHIAEPVPNGFIRHRYDTDDQRQLAERMKDLSQAIARQCAKREMAAVAFGAAIREAIFRRLLFGQATSVDAQEVDAGTR